MSTDVFVLVVIASVIAVALGGQSAAGNQNGGLNITFNCRASNDLYRAVADAGAKCPRYDTASEAIEHAAPGSGVLILADGYPDVRVKLDSALLDSAASKRLKLYVEYPDVLPGLELGDVRGTQWERGVVSSDAFGNALPKLQILSISDCHFIPVNAADPMLVVARVAGYDTAVYGLPKEAYPILFRIPHREMIVATTKLSGFITGRYAPSNAWGRIWEYILSQLDPQSSIRLKWTPSVHPAYGPSDKLPADFERRAQKDSIKWYLNSRLLIHPKDKPKLDSLLKSAEELRPMLGPDAPVGDGTLGIQEGYAAGIRFDGTQLQRLPVRADCNAEVAMALSLDADKRGKDTAKNLLDYVYFTSNMCGGARGNPKHPAFGLIAWGSVVRVWEVANYGDDNARALLATIVAAASLKSDQWNEMILRGLLANLRTTGKLGFRGDRIDVPSLEEQGWKAYADASPINCAAHFESYLWACYLWGYRQTGYKPFLEKAKSGIKITMENYPDGWRWRDSNERARMLLCLSWLVRLEDTLQHRQWLQSVAYDLLKVQQPCGALQERIPPGGKGGHYNVPSSNEAYGTGETPLIQNDGDPATDQLYTTGFALLGLHEAVAAIGDQRLREAEDKLAQFLCRIQVKSKDQPYLSGSWFRAFDYNRWDYWASSGDAGWGAWCAETGWGTAWISAMLGLRVQGTSVWDFTSGVDVAHHFSNVWKQMSENDGSPWKGEPWVPVSK